MSTRLDVLRMALRERFPKSRLEPLTDQQIAGLRRRFPDFPQHLTDFFSQIGCGSIGDSMYMIYGLIEPEEIFDKETAAGVKGVVLIGDDFAGHHEAYDTRSRWTFGSVRSGGGFERHSKYRTFIDFIEDWFAKD